MTGPEIGDDFRMLTRRIGLRAAGASHGPRIHDLRHRFAVADAGAVVSDRKGRCSITAGALDLPGPCVHHRHLLVSHLHD